ETCHDAAQDRASLRSLASTRDDVHDGAGPGSPPVPAFEETAHDRGRFQGREAVQIQRLDDRRVEQRVARIELRAASLSLHRGLCLWGSHSPRIAAFTACRKLSGSNTSASAPYWSTSRANHAGSATLNVTT